MLSDDGNGLRRGDVVPRNPIVVAAGGEVFLNDLLVSRQSVSSAHLSDYAQVFGGNDEGCPERAGLCQ